MIPWGCLRALPLLSLQVSLRLCGHPAQTGISGEPILVAFDLNDHRRAGPHPQQVANLALSQARIFQEKGGSLGSALKIKVDFGPNRWQRVEYGASVAVGVSWSDLSRDRPDGWKLAG